MAEISAHILLSIRHYLQKACRPLGMLMAGIIFTVLASTGYSAPANAAIKCRGMYQVIKGHGLLATPYCEDKWLAAYVRRYGVKVSFDEIRKNPAKKDEICRFLRHDSKIRSVCGTVTDDDFSTRRF